MVTGETTKYPLFYYRLLLDVIPYQLYVSSLVWSRVVVLYLATTDLSSPLAVSELGVSLSLTEVSVMFPARYSPDQPSTARPSADQGRVRRAHTVYTGAGEICQVPPGYHHGTTNTLTASLAMSDYYQYLSTVSSDHHLSWPAGFSRNIKIKSQSGDRQWCCLPRTAGRLCGPVRGARPGPAISRPSPSLQ